MYEAQNNGFIIGIQGLSQGRHTFRFHVDKTLFESFGNSQILDADIDVTIELDKEGRRMLLTDCSEGYVVVECDRCLDELRLPVSLKTEAEVVFAEQGAAEESGEYLVVDSSDGELDVTQFVYDYICINLPLRKVHKEGECNRQMLDRLQQASSTEENASRAAGNSPFKDLEKLLNKENNN